MKPVSIKSTDSLDDAEIQETVEDARVVAYGEHEQCSELTTMAMEETADAKGTAK